VIVNLCTNAYQAMTDGKGTLQITVDSIDVDSAIAGTHPDLKAKRYVRLTVTDTGDGMEQSTVERIFEPFFTTKTKQQGTGLGLSMVHGIVLSCGGAITVNSIVGKGSTFTVYFPEVQNPDVPKKEAVGPILRGKGEHILVVDDESALARLEKEMLEHMGYRVTMRVSSIEALGAFRAQPAKFDAILSDQTMPQKTGLELAKEVRQARSDIPIVIATGFSEGIEEKARSLGVGILMKPILMDDLAQTMRVELDRIDGSRRLRARVCQSAKGARVGFGNRGNHQEL